MAGRNCILVSTSFLQKFICTTVRPTCLPYKELYDFESCAKFVADYLAYEPLSVPNELVSVPRVWGEGGGGE